MCLYLSSCTENQCSDPTQLETDLSYRHGSSVLKLRDESSITIAELRFKGIDGLRARDLNSLILLQIIACLHRNTVSHNIVTVLVQALIATQVILSQERRYSGQLSRSSGIHAEAKY